MSDFERIDETKGVIIVALREIYKDNIKLMPGVQEERSGQDKIYRVDFGKVSVTLSKSSWPREDYESTDSLRKLERQVKSLLRRTFAALQMGEHLNRTIEHSASLTIDADSGLGRGEADDGRDIESSLAAIGIILNLAIQQGAEGDYSIEFKLPNDDLIAGRISSTSDSVRGFVGGITADAAVGIEKIDPECPAAERQEWLKEIVDSAVNALVRSSLIDSIPSAPTCISLSSESLIGTGPHTIHGGENPQALEFYPQRNRAILIGRDPETNNVYAMRCSLLSNDPEFADPALWSREIKSALGSDASRYEFTFALGPMPKFNKLSKAIVAAMTQEAQAGGFSDLTINLDTVAGRRQALSRALVKAVCDGGGLAESVRLLRVDWKRGQEQAEGFYNQATGGIIIDVIERR